MLTVPIIPIFPTRIINILIWMDSTKVSAWQNFVSEKGTYLFSAKVMGLPDSFTCEQGTGCDRIEGLCLLLR